MIVIKVWDLRTQRGMSLRTLATCSGISKSTINRIENGVTSPTIAELDALANVLGCAITDLFAVL